MITDCCHKSTFTEPQNFGWEIIEKFYPDFESVFLKKLEKFGRKIYRLLEINKEYDFNDDRKRYGLIVANFIRN